MAQAPVMPLFTDALIGDTTHLTTRQFGAYMLILIATWRNNGQALPNDDIRLARTCRQRLEDWRRYTRPVLVQFFNISDGFWHQKRLDLEWERASVFRSSQKTKAVASLKARGLKPKKPRLTGGSYAGSTMVQPVFQPTLNHNKENPSSSVREVAARAPLPAGGAVAPRDTEHETAWTNLSAILHAPPPPPNPEANGHDLRVQTHMRFLKARGGPDDLALYLAAQMSDDPSHADRMFNLTEEWMTEEGWQAPPECP